MFHSKVGSGACRPEAALFRRRRLRKRQSESSPPTGGGEEQKEKNAVFEREEARGQVLVRQRHEGEGEGEGRVCAKRSGCYTDAFCLVRRNDADRPHHELGHFRKGCT